MRILFLLLVVLWMGSPVSAKGKKAPKSQLKSFYYHVGGGMSISVRMTSRLILKPSLGTNVTPATIQACIITTK